MTCWKTINLNKDYGFHRITLISLISMLLAFICFYLPMNLMYSPDQMGGDGIIVFLLALVLIVPLHELLHALPLWTVRKKVNFNIKCMYTIIPVVSTRLRHTLSKPVILIMLVTPFLLITSLMLTACILFPEYIHYFTIFAAINFGLCVPDFIYIKAIIKAPKSCIVEEIEDGYDILINK